MNPLELCPTAAQETTWEQQRDDESIARYDVWNQRKARWGWD